MGRPPPTCEIKELILKLTDESRPWGYIRMQGTLAVIANLRHEVGRGTIANVLRAAEMEPAPARRQGKMRNELPRSHWEVLAATDFSRSSCGRRLA